MSAIRILPDVLINQIAAGEGESALFCDHRSLAWRAGEAVTVSPRPPSGLGCGR